MSYGHLSKLLFKQEGGLLPVFFFLFFLTSCNHLFYHPSEKVFQPTPREISLVKRDISFFSQDGTPLHGWLFVHPRAKGTVIQFHGNAENMSSHYLNIAWLFKKGYNLFTFDYRGYGRLFNTPISPEGVRLDGVAALKKGLQLHQQISPQGKFIVIGQSLGGTIALKAAADWPTPRDIDLVVIDSSFVSYQEIAFKKLKSHWLSWPLSPLAFVLVSDRTSAEKNLREWRTPLLVVHSKNDPVVPFSCAQKIYTQTDIKQKWFWKIPGDGHMTSFHHPFWQKKLLNFIDNEIVSRQ